MIYGCVTSQIASGEGDSENAGMFKIVSRRANFLDVILKGDIKLGLTILKQDITGLTNLSDSTQLTIIQDNATESYLAKVVLKNE